MKLIPESSTKEEISQSSSKRSPGWQTRAEKVKHNLTASEGDQIDQCHTGSHPSPEDMSSTAMPNQLGIQDSKEMEADQRIEEVKQIALIACAQLSYNNGKKEKL